tara:strand:+ start:8711 stop:9637 length:927 start_codon:yes stop_codon:yes gene_type:complete
MHIILSVLALSLTAFAQTPNQWQFAKVMPISCMDLEEHIHHYNQSQYVKNNNEKRLHLQCEAVGKNKSIALVTSDGGLCHSPRKWEKPETMWSWVSAAEDLGDNLKSLFLGRQTKDLDKFASFLRNNGIQAHAWYELTLSQQQILSLQYPKCPAGNPAGSTKPSSDFKGVYQGLDQYNNPCQIWVKHQRAKAPQQAYYLLETRFFEETVDGLIQTTFKFPYDIARLQTDLNQQRLETLIQAEADGLQLFGQGQNESYSMALDISESRQPESLNIEHHSLRSRYKYTGQGKQFKTVSYSCRNLKKIRSY